MKRVLYAAVATAALVAPLAITAQAQVTKTVTGEQKTVTATVEAIERSTRTVTLKEQNGQYTEISVPADVKRFDTMKIGDKITAKYYENIVLRLKLPGEQATDTGSAAVTPSPGEKPGGRQPPSGPSPRRLPISIRKCRRSPSAGRTAGPTARALKTKRRSQRSRSAIAWTSRGQWRS